ncbi:MAG: aspartate-semialdehyde dehydrogenase [Burkholderiales bacterium]|nr:aspartate-semialdehyde dehydrogenase [Burkholderiales bacterium]
MLSVGFVGFRGMVGSVLINRMIEENDFNKIKAFFFSTSQAGGKCPIKQSKNQILLDAYNVDQLLAMDCIVSTQGSNYTNAILPKLKIIGYAGYIIDASSALRMNDDTILVLDPVNKEQIINGLNNGVKYFAGANCSISLPLIGLNGLLKKNLIEWMSIMTYQAASGAGANQVRELLKQMQVISDTNTSMIKDDNNSILELIHNVNKTIQATSFPTQEFAAPLAGSIIPWIDADLGNGMSKEEYKGQVEANKLLGLASNTIKIDGLCIRVGVIRSHSAAITMKLNQNLTIDEIEKIIKSDNLWVNYIPNNKTATLHQLNPVVTSESLKIAVGRLKKSSVGENIYNVLTVGDQLLWGAAEPVRRMLNILVEYKA